MDWGEHAFAQTACVSCGACAELCPTGAISDADRDRQGTTGSRTVRTTCAYCGVGCQLDVHTDGTDIVSIDGAPSPVNDRHLCVKGRYAHAYVRHPERLTTPLLRRGDAFEPISWEEALALAGREFSRLRGRLGFLSSARCTNEENYLVQKWARAGMGTNNVDCCARVCHAPSAAGMRRMFGTGAATNSFADIDRADLLFVCGANPSESHPVVGARVKRAVLSGRALLVVIDPRETELAQIADVHLQPRPGTNVPLLNAIAAVLVEEGLVDRAFVEARADGLRELSLFLADKSPEQSEATTGVPAGLVRRAARMYAAAARPMQLHGLGVTEHYQGSETVMLLCNLAILAGAIGREGVGVNPLRGQNNVQGAADMGCQPDLATGYASVSASQTRARFRRLWNAPLPGQPGLTIPRMYDSVDRGELAGLYILGEDVATTDPDTDRIRRTLSRLDFLVVQEIFLSDTARLAHLVLPGASAFEKDGTFTNAERRLQRVRRVLAPPGEARADWQILVELMKACGMDAPYTGPRDVFDEIREAWPALAAASWDTLGENGLQWPVDAETGTGTPILHLDAFAGGRPALPCIDYVASPSSFDPQRPLHLTTGRVLEHYNSGSMTRRTDTVRIASADVLEIHPVDAAARGIADGDEVMVTSATGTCRAHAKLSAGVRPGALFLSFHFPATGTNAVTSGVVDRIADCPEYKLTSVEVRKT